MSSIIQFKAHIPTRMLATTITLKTTLITAARRCSPKEATRNQLLVHNQNTRLSTPALYRACGHTDYEHSTFNDVITKLPRTETGRRREDYPCTSSRMYNSLARTYTSTSFRTAGKHFKVHAYYSRVSHHLLPMQCCYVLLVTTIN